MPTSILADGLGIDQLRVDGIGEPLLGDLAESLDQRGKRRCR